MGDLSQVHSFQRAHLQLETDEESEKGSLTRRCKKKGHRKLLHIDHHVQPVCEKTPVTPCQLQQRDPAGGGGRSCFANDHGCPRLEFRPHGAAGKKKWTLRRRTGGSFESSHARTLGYFYRFLRKEATGSTRQQGPTLPVGGPKKRLVGGGGGTPYFGGGCKRKRKRRKPTAGPR